MYYQNLIKASDELGCTETIIKHDDGIVEIGNLLFKDEKRYSKDEFSYISDNWQKFFKKKPSTEEIFGELDPNFYDEERDDPCEFDAECIEKEIANSSQWQECTSSKFNFNGKQRTICRYYRQPYVNVHEETKQYGGPEEGGWYYTKGLPLEAVPVFSKEDSEYVEKMLEGLRYMCYPDGKLNIRTGCAIVKGYPKYPPIYS
jgi:hypothetical protein